MSGRPSTFRLSNVKRAFIGAKMAGIEVDRMTVAPAGTISIVPKRDEAAKPRAPKTPDATGLHEWD